MKEEFSNQHATQSPSSAKTVYMFVVTLNQQIQIICGFIQLL